MCCSYPFFVKSHACYKILHITNSTFSFLSKIVLFHLIIYSDIDIFSNENSWENTIELEPMFLLNSNKVNCNFIRKWIRTVTLGWKNVYCRNFRRIYQIISAIPMKSKHRYHDVCFLVSVV